MGRAKLSIKPISRERCRNETFKKRSKGLIKKTFELATLCGIEVCMICLGPQNNQLKVETWPKDPQQVKCIIKRYRSLSREDQDRRKYGVLSYIEDKKKKLEIELEKTRKLNAEKLWPTWDKRLDGLQQEQLRELQCKLDLKLADVKSRIESLMGQRSLKGNELEIFSESNQNPYDYMLDKKPVSLDYMLMDQSHPPLDYGYSITPSETIYGNLGNCYNYAPLSVPPLLRIDGSPMLENQKASMFHGREFFDGQHGNFALRRGELFDQENWAWKGESFDHGTATLRREEPFDYGNSASRRDVFDHGNWAQRRGDPLNGLPRNSASSSFIPMGHLSSAASDLKTFEPFGSDPTVSDLYNNPHPW